LQIVPSKGHEKTFYANELNATPPSGSGSEAAVEMLSPSPSVVPLPILAASRHWSLLTPTDGDGDEAMPLCRKGRARTLSQASKIAA
jgi:hypothetical protein